MRVRLLVSRAVIGEPQNMGDEITVPDDEAVRMIEAGQAEPVRAKKAPEKATKRRKAERASK
jgi:hypothetical protein